MAYNLSQTDTTANNINNTDDLPLVEKTNIDAEFIKWLEEDMKKDEEVTARICFDFYFKGSIK